MVAVSGRCRGLRDQRFDCRRCARRGLHALFRRPHQAHGELPRIRWREQFGAEPEQQRGGDASEQRGDGDHRARAFEQAGDQGFQGGAELGLVGREGAALDHRRARQEPGAERRNQKHRHCEGGEQRQHHGEGDAVDQARRQPFHEQHRQEDDARRQGAGDDGASDLASAGGGGLQGRIAGAEAAEHGLDDDDGVVHQHADAERQSAEGDDVQAVVGEVHAEQRGEDGDRHRRGDDQRGAGRAQEEREHQHREHDAGGGGDL